MIEERTKAVNPNRKVFNIKDVNIPDKLMNSFKLTKMLQQLEENELTDVFNFIINEYKDIDSAICYIIVFVKQRQMKMNIYVALLRLIYGETGKRPMPNDSFDNLFNIKLFKAGIFTENEINDITKRFKVTYIEVYDYPIHHDNSQYMINYSPSLTSKKLNDILEHFYVKDSLKYYIIYDMDDKLHEELVKLLSKHSTTNYKVNYMYALSCFFGSQKCIELFLREKCQFSENVLLAVAASGNIDILQSVDDTNVTYANSAREGVIYNRNNAVDYLLSNKDTRGFTLNEALFSANIPAMIYCIENNAACSPLLLNTAVISGYFDLLQFLVEDFGVEINSPLSRPLYYACHFERISMVKYLLCKGANPNGNRPGETTPLHAVCYNSNIDILKLLLEKKPDINVRDSDGRTPFYSAVQYGNLEVIEFMFGLNPDINALSYSNFSPLYQAIQSNRIKIAEFLIKNGAMINNGDPCIFAPIELGTLETITYAIDIGSDVNAKNSLGDTPITNAIKHKKAKILDMLIRKGLNLEEPDSQGDYPIHIAARNCLLCTKILIANNCSIDVLNANKNKPMTEALNSNKTDVHKLLTSFADLQTKELRKEFVAKLRDEVIEELST